MKILKTSIFTAIIAILGLFPQSFAAENRPFERSLKVDVPLLALGLGCVALGSYRYAEMEPRSGAPDRENLLPWDRPFAGTKNRVADKLSDIAAVAILAPFILEGVDWYRGDSDAEEALTFLTMAVEIACIQDGINLMTRSSRLWPRPMLFRSDANREKGSDWGSFYSGHTSAAFSLAVFTGMWFSEKHTASPYAPLVWGAALSLASAEGVLRIAAGKHFPTDVVVGALAGSAVSFFVVKLHENSHVSVAAMPGGARVVVSY